KTTTITAKADGPIEQVQGLMNYAAVNPGQVLLVQGTNDVDAKITAKREQVVAAQKSLEAAEKKVADEEKNLLNFSATASIAGTVTACALAPGMEVASGLAAITISDNTIMTVNINVDERNVSYIKTGMDINLSDYNGGSYMGIVESVASIGKSENGVTVFPVVVKVENTTGTLLGGMYLDYQFTAAQSNDCIVIPIQDVRYASLGDEKPTPVVYLQSDTAPEGAIDVTTLPAEMQAEIPKGCFVIKVETGLSDDMNVEIKSGLKDGDMVFNNIPKPEGAWG
ncbi:MAG: efflux RND transporter periplasmic adaptor subunit, partial [Pseudoflavonifractor sp.]